jgi:GR25 family glycosyltransferase involved in LPS biosynthesis
MEYNKVWDFFDEIYCINLDHRIDRWEKVQKEFESVGLLPKVKRFSAIKEKDGRLGVIKSNLAIVKMAKEKGLNNVLVFEDDVHFINDTVDILEKALSQIGNLDWWLLYLGANTHEPLKFFTKSKPNLLILKSAFACHAFCYRNKTYDFFIRKYEGLEKVEYGDILDVFMAQYFQKKNICLLVNPIVATQSASYSDIEKQNVDYSFIEERFKNNTKNLM